MRLSRDEPLDSGNTRLLRGLVGEGFVRRFWQRLVVAVDTYRQQWSHQITYLRKLCGWSVLCQ